MENGITLFFMGIMTRFNTMVHKQSIMGLLQQPPSMEDSASRASGWEVAMSLARLTVTERDIRGEELHESGGTNHLSVANYEDEGVPGRFQAQDSR